jgi:uncharacterized protein YuzE
MNVQLSSTGSAYIRYTTEASAKNEFVGGDEGSDIIADLDANGCVVGIEIVDVAIPGDIERARSFASERGLPFPRDLAAAVRDASAAT